MWLTHLVCKLHARSFDFYLSPRFCLPVARRIRGKFPKGSSLRTEFGSRISSRYLGKLFFHPRHCNFFSAQTLRIHVRPAGCEQKRVAYRIWMCKVRGEWGHKNGKGDKYLEYRSVMWRRVQASRRGARSHRRRLRYHIARWILRGYLHERNILWST